MIFKTKGKEENIENKRHFKVVAGKEQIQAPPIIPEKELCSKMDIAYKEGNAKEFLTLYKVWSDHYWRADIV